MEQRDPAFVQLHQQALEECLEKKRGADAGLEVAASASSDQGPVLASASTDTVGGMPEAYNPWAAGAATSPVASNAEHQGDAGDEDNDFDDMYA